MLRPPGQHCSEHATKRLLGGAVGTSLQYIVTLALLASVSAWPVACSEHLMMVLYVEALLALHGKLEKFEKHEATSVVLFSGLTGVRK